jgi:hypothetical protein
MRIATEMSVEGLRQHVGATQQDVNRSLGELQDLVIAQREATHTLEKELLAHKSQTEMKLAEDARRIASLDRHVHAAAGALEPYAAAERDGGGGHGGGGGGGVGGLGAIASRLKEVELALLNERDLRKAVEHEVSAPRRAPPLLCLAF